MISGYAVGKGVRAAELLATLPPMEQATWLLGSGA